MSRTELDDCELDELISFAEKWAGLGDAIASQVKEVVEWNYSPNNTEFPQCNPNAIRIAHERLGRRSYALREALEAWMKEHESHCNRSD